MRTPLVAAAGALCVGLIVAPAKADLAPPAPPPKEVKFVIEVDENAKAPKLLVPQGLVNPRVRPRPLPPGAAKEDLAVLEYEADEGALEPARHRLHLLIAGVAVTLALGLGGVWLVRRKGSSSIRGLALLLAAGATLGFTTMVWADIPVPKRPPAKKEVVVLPVAFDGKLTMELVPGGDTIRLVLDKTSYEAIKKEPKQPEKR